MKFTDMMRQEAEPIFSAIVNHPFVQGIGKGELKKEQLIHYVKQDYKYLTSFMRVYGIGVAKCTERKDIAMFHEKIGFILNDETHPHHNFCDVAGVKYEDLQGEPLAPTAVHYISHMLSAAQHGSLAEILAVLLPCPWTYMEIGQTLIEQYRPDKSHPFYDWIVFYGDTPPRIKTFRDRIDELAEDASNREKEQMLDHFLKSCQLEYMFFDMAYKVEQWPVSVDAVHVRS